MYKGLWSLPPRPGEPGSPFQVGTEALIKGSFEVVTIKAVSAEAILVERAGGQWSYRPDQLEPFNPDVCPIN